MANYYRTQKVEVKHNGIWVKGVVQNVEGRGAGIRTDKGQSFYFWNNVRPDAQAERASKRSSSGATLGDIMPQHLKEAVAQKERTTWDLVVGPKDPTPQPVPRHSDPMMLGRPYLDDHQTPSKPARPTPPGFGEKGKPRVMKPRARSRPRTPSAIGDAMKAIRVQRGLTQEALGNKMPIARSRLVTIETGDTLPDLVEVERFAKALGFDVGPLKQILGESIRDRTQVVSAATPKNKRPKKVALPLPALPTIPEPVVPLPQRPIETPPLMPPSLPNPFPPEGIKQIRIKIGGVEVEGISVEETARLIKILQAEESK